MSSVSHPAPPIVVMGVSGVGKTTVGQILSDRRHALFIDADDLHGPANVAKMSAGIPLVDADRWPWLERVGAALAAEPGVVVACSALRRVYRDHLRRAAPETVFVHLVAQRQQLVAQSAAREHHFMPGTLIDSQLAALEPLGIDERGLAVTVDAAPPALVERIETLLGRISHD